MDPSWCPGCDRLILPKRYIVPIPPPPQIPSPASSSSSASPPAPPPTPEHGSPEVRKRPLAGPGLVRGTGGLKPRKRPVAANTNPPPPIPAPEDTPTRKTRVVISQEPTPLYCSDECRARDLKNSFIESESKGFAGAPAAIHHVNQLELVEASVEQSMRNRRAKHTSKERAAADAYPIPMPPHPPQLLRTESLSSASTASTSSSRVKATESRDSTIRAPTARKARPPLPRASFSSATASFSPSKAALAPPVLNASSSSLASSASVCSLFEADADAGSSATSRRGSGSSAEGKKKKKRVSFKEDVKCVVAEEAKHVESEPAAAQPAAVSAPTSKTAPPSYDWRAYRRRNVLLDAHPLRDAVSVSPKDRVRVPTLSTESVHSAPAHTSHAYVTSTHSSATTTPARYGVAMWPEDEKRTTECARVHGALLRGYAKRFGPREGRSLVWGRLWGAERDEVAREEVTLVTAGSEREYWRLFEEREAEARARRRAEAAVVRAEEERVIGELLGGAGMREEDQPQARRMRRMAYDGMPGPAELRGLTYKFDRFLYPLMQPKPTIVERTVRRWDEARGTWVEEVTREEVYPERKKLFNFVED